MKVMADFLSISCRNETVPALAALLPPGIVVRTTFRTVVLEGSATDVRKFIRSCGVGAAATVWRVEARYCCRDDGSDFWLLRCGLTVAEAEGLLRQAESCLRASVAAAT